MSSSTAAPCSPRQIACVVFDVDDTLYDKGTGFSDHRNFDGAPNFMVQHLGFPSLDEAKALRNAYFAKYHSTAKALQQAQADGKFPPSAMTKFESKDLDDYFATKLDFEILGGPKSDNFQSDMRELSKKVELVAFSNGPRNYVIRVLQELGLWGTDTDKEKAIFSAERLFAVNDTLPHCKPEKEAFDKVFASLTQTSSTSLLQPHQCIMVEDSMKNIRKAKELGLGTILIVGEGKLHPSNEDEPLDDGPVVNDPAVDVAIETIEELRTVLPGLWEDPPVFVPPTNKNK